jgi:hypothetical protein
VPQSLDQNHLQQLARLGAPVRIAQLRAEIEAIQTAFPGLNGAASRRQSGRRRTRARAGSEETAAALSTSADTAEQQAAAPARSTKNGAWTPARRKAQAEMMRRYWAKRKSGKKR